MAVIAKLYGNALLKALNKEINWSSDSIKVMLCTSAYAPNQDTHIYKSDVTNEVVGTGYTAGGQLLSSKTITYDGASNTIKLDAADVSWPSSTITCRYAVVYDDTGTAATSALIGYVDFGADYSATNGTVSVTWDATGIFTLVAS